MSWLDPFFAGYQTSQNGGVALPQRSIIDFGSGLSAVDDPSGGRTIVTAAGAGSAFYQTLQNNGLAITQRPKINALPPIVALDNPGNNSSDLSLVSGLSDGFYLMQVTSGAGQMVIATSDMISAGLVVTLSGGSGGVFECGNTWTLTGLTANPACNAVGVTAATLTEIINSVAGTSTNVLGVPNTISGANLPHTSYTRNGSGDIVDLQLAMTKSGFSKSSNLGSVRGTYLDRYYVGSGSGGAGTSATSSGNNAALVGDSGTLTGTLGAFNVGSTFNIPAGAAAYWYLWVLHTGGAMTFKAAGAPFAMTRVTSSSAYPNQFSVSHNFDLYVSNQLTQAYTVTRDT